MTEDKYPAFPPIKRLRRSMTVTEKIDGTNGLIHISDDFIIRAGSRNRWLSEEKNKDNFGFGRWVHENATALMADLGEGHHYGEWWGLGIQRHYDRAHKTFSLFNTGRWNDEALARFTTPNLSVVPTLYLGAYSTGVIDDQLRELEKYGSVAAPGFVPPEGVVVYHHATRTYAKVTLDGDGAKGKR